MMLNAVMRGVMTVQDRIAIMIRRVAWLGGVNSPGGIAGRWPPIEFVSIVGRQIERRCRIRQVGIVRRIRILAGDRRSLQAESNRSSQRWSRFFEQNFRVDKWNLCRD
jgi:hypothetical protein